MPPKWHRPWSSLAISKAPKVKPWTSGHRLRRSQPHARCKCWTDAEPLPLLIDSSRLLRCCTLLSHSIRGWVLWGTPLCSHRSLTKPKASKIIASGKWKASGIWAHVTWSDWDPTTHLYQSASISTSSPHSPSRWMRARNLRWSGHMASPEVDSVVWWKLTRCLACAECHHVSPPRRCSKGSATNCSK